MKRNIIYINLPLCLIIILSILNTNYALRPKVKQKQKSIDRVNMEGHISNEELYKRIQEYEQKFQDPTIATKFDQMIDDLWEAQKEKTHPSPTTIPHSHFAVKISNGAIIILDSTLAHIDKLQKAASFKTKSSTKSDILQLPTTILINLGSDNLQFIDPVHGYVVNTVPTDSTPLSLAMLSEYRIAVGQENGQILILESSGNIISKISHGEGGIGGVTALYWDNILERLWSGGKDKNIIIWEGKEFKKVKSFSYHNSYITTIKGLNTGSMNYILSGGMDKIIIGMDIEGNIIRKYSLTHAVYSLLPLPYDGTIINNTSYPEGVILAGCENGELYLWDVAGQLISQFKPHGANINALALAQHSHPPLILTGGVDKNIKLINLWNGQLLSDYFIGFAVLGILEIIFEPDYQNLKYPMQ